jgi:hypothetical protein
LKHRLNLLISLITNLNYFIIKIQIFKGVFKMKLRFLFIAILALLVSGCMDTIMAVPAAAVDGVGNVVGGIWGAVTSIF